MFHVAMDELLCQQGDKSQVQVLDQLESAI